MAINLNLLRSFYFVAEAGSVSKAAEMAHISQPALSKAVRELEKQLGLVLMERTARGVILTGAGETLRAHARAIFELERATEEAISAHRSLKGGILRIGASTTLATYVLPPLLGEFARAHPHLTLRLARENTRRIEELLVTYQLDVAIVEGPPRDPRLSTRAWREEELVCVCAPDNPLAGRELVWPEELRSQKWVVREEGSGTREVIERALRPHGLPPAGALEIGGAEAVKQAVAAGLGIAIVSRASAADQLALGKLRVLPLAEIELRRPFYILSLPNRPPSPAARSFEGFLLGASVRSDDSTVSYASSIG